MIILGLTGSIGMGKSATAKIFRAFGIPVHDADAAVHGLMSNGGAATVAIDQAFPDCLKEDGSVDRQKLGAMVFGNDENLKRLEAILHPLVRKEEQKFLRKSALARQKIVVLDIPLLFETKGEKRCDYVIVVSAPAYLQKKRVMARAGMNLDKFQAILKKQMPDVEKRQKADFVISSAQGFRSARNQVKKIIQSL
jgi:dephospho-CoA kinase